MFCFQASNSGNKQSKWRMLLSKDRIQLRTQYIQTSCSLLFLRRALCHLASLQLHFNILFWKKSSTSFNSTRYSSGAFAHFGHSVMLYCIFFALVKLKQFQQLTKLTQTNNENCHHKESYKNGTVSQRCCATDFPFLSSKLMQSIFFLMLAFNFF